MLSCGTMHSGGTRAPAAYLATPLLLLLQLLLHLLCMPRQRVRLLLQRCYGALHGLVLLHHLHHAVVHLQDSSSIA